MDTPLISIVLCTYNGAAFLAEQMDSIISQTYPHLEIVISDDCSTDQTQTILANYAHHRSIRIVYNEVNVGFIKNFERALLLTTGKYIAFSDQDDIWLPEKIEKLVGAIGTYPLVYSDSLLIDNTGKSLHKKLSDLKKMKNNLTDSRGFAFLNVVSGHTMMIERGLLNHALPLPDGFYHDWWFAMQAVNLRGISFLNEVLTLYRQHNQTVTKTIVENRSGSRKRQERYEAFLKDIEWLTLLKNNKTEKHKEFFETFYDLFLQKKDRRYAWPLFFFMLRNEKILFQFSNKSYASNVLRIRKMARGERSS